MQSQSNPSRAIQSFITNSENTMNTALTASVASLLTRLSKIYLGDDEEKQIAEYLRRFADVYPDKNALQYIQGKMGEPLYNSLDYTVIWENGSETRYCIPIRKTLAIVYAALTDLTQYNLYFDETDEDTREIKIAQDQWDRLLPLFNTITSMHTSPNAICHQGIRHNIAFTLNGVYPGVELIEDLQMCLNAMISDHIAAHLATYDELLFLEMLRHEFGKEKDRHPYLVSWLKKSVPAIRQMIEQKLVQHGINTANCFAVIDNILDNLFQFPLPLDNNRFAMAVKYILLDAKDTNDLRGQEKHNISMWLMNSFIVNMENKRAVENFAYVDKLYVLFTEYGDILKDWNEQYIDIEQLYYLETFFSYFYNSCNNKFIPPIDIQTADLLRLFQNAYKQFRQDPSITWIENFFANYQIAKNNLNDESDDDEFYVYDNSDSSDFFANQQVLQVALQNVYQTLYNQKMRDKVIVTTGFLEAIFGSSEVNLNPHEINRIFLHAILVPPEKWTGLYAKCLNKVYKFVSERFANHENRFQSEAIMNDSYNKELLDQIAYLMACHDFHSDETNSLAQPEAPKSFWIPMTHLIKNATHLIDMLNLFGKNIQPEYVNTHAVLIRSIIKSFDDLFIIANEFMKNAPEDDYDYESQVIISILLLFRDDLQTLIQTPDKMKKLIQCCDPIKMIRILFDPTIFNMEFLTSLLGDKEIIKHLIRYDMQDFLNIIRPFHRDVFVPFHADISQRTSGFIDFVNLFSNNHLNGDDFLILLRYFKDYFHPWNNLDNFLLFHKKLSFSLQNTLIQALNKTGYLKILTPDIKHVAMLLDNTGIDKRGELINILSEAPYSLKNKINDIYSFMNILGKLPARSQQLFIASLSSASLEQIIESIDERPDKFFAFLDWLQPDNREKVILNLSPECFDKLLKTNSDISACALLSIDSQTSIINAISESKLQELILKIDNDNEYFTRHFRLERFLCKVKEPCRILVINKLKTSLHLFVKNDVFTFEEKARYELLQMILKFFPRDAEAALIYPALIGFLQALPNPFSTTDEKIFEAYLDYVRHPSKEKFYDALEYIQTKNFWFAMRYYDIHFTDVELFNVSPDLQKKILNKMQGLKLKINDTRSLLVVLNILDDSCKPLFMNLLDDQTKTEISLLIKPQAQEDSATISDKIFSLYGGNNKRERESEDSDDEDRNVKQKKI